MCCCCRYQKTRCNFKLSYCRVGVYLRDRTGWRDLFSPTISSNDIKHGPIMRHTQFIMIKIFLRSQIYFSSFFSRYSFSFFSLLCRISWFSCVLSFLNKFSYKSVSHLMKRTSFSHWATKFSDLNISISFFSGSLLFSCASHSDSDPPPSFARLLVYFT